MVSVRVSNSSGSGTCIGEAEVVFQECIPKEILSHKTSFSIRIAAPFVGEPSVVATGSVGVWLATDWDVVVRIRVDLLQDPDEILHQQPFQGISNRPKPEPAFINKAPTRRSKQYPIVPGCAVAVREHHALRQVIVVLQDELRVRRDVLAAVFR